MTDFFSKFPRLPIRRPSSTDKSLPNQKPNIITIDVVDVMVRYRVRQEILFNTSLFYPYIWKDHDRPDTVARKYYGSEKYHWVVFYSNNSFDLNYDFPMPGNQFREFLIQKYRQEIIDTQFGGDEQLFEDASQLTKIKRMFTYTTQTFKHFEIDNRFIVSQTEFQQFDGPKRVVSLYDFENDINEAKREIQLLDNDVLGQILSEHNTEYRQAKRNLEIARRNTGE